VRLRKGENENIPLKNVTLKEALFGIICNPDKWWKEYRHHILCWEKRDVYGAIIYQNCDYSVDLDYFSHAQWLNLIEREFENDI